MNELYSDVKANPTIANVQNGVAAYKASGADFIVALGGGSSIQCFAVTVCHGV